jgi:hypothetical protein
MYVNNCLVLQINVLDQYMILHYLLFFCCLTEFNYQYPDCDHIQVARLIYDRYDFNNEILPLAERIRGQGYFFVGISLHVIIKPECMY